VAICAALAAAGSAASAQDTWNGGVDFNWDTGANWLNSVALNLPPTASDAVTFSAGGAGTITLGAGEQALSLNFLATYTLQGGDLTLGNGANATITAGAGFTASISSMLQGTGGVTITGPGTVALSGANTFTGGLTLSGGTLDINGASSLGAATNAFTINGGTIDNTSGGLVTLNNYLQNWNSDFTFGGTNALNMGTGAVTLGASRTVTVSGTSALTVGGAIGGATFGLTKAGNGTLVLNGIIGTTTGTVTASAGTLTLAGANTYSGATSLSSPATLNFNNTKAIGTGVLVISGGTLDNTSGAAITNANNNTQTWTGGFTFGGTQPLNMGTGNVSVNASVNPTITINGTGSLIEGGVIAFGANNLTITGASGNGGLILAGTNTGTGTITINANGKLQMGNTTANGAIPTGVMTINSGGNFILAPGTANFTLANVINGAGTITLSGTTASSPPGVTLSATTGTFTGNYILNQGRLAVTAQTNLGGATAPITVNGSATNGGQLWVNANVTIANPITLNGGGPLEATGNGAGLGAIRFNTGTYSGPITLGSNAAINPQNTAATVSGSISGPNTAVLTVGTFKANVGGTLTITSTNNTYAGGTSIAGATLAANAVGALGTGPITLQNLSNSVLTESVANALTGTNSLTLLGGTATLSQANNYTGGTTVSGGTLAINAVGATSTVGIVQNGGTITESVANAITGVQSLSVSGGTANLSQANNYTGGTIVSGTGTVNASVASAVPAGLVVNGGAVNVSASGGISGTVNVNGGIVSSTVTTGAANSGTILLNGGALGSGATGGLFGTVIGGTSANIITPGGLGTTGIMAINNLTTGAGTILQFDVAVPWVGTPATTGDLLNLTGTFTLGAGTTIGFGFGAPTESGEYRLIQYSGTTAPALPNSLLPTGSRPGIAYAFDTTTDPGFIDLLVSNAAAAINAIWTPSAGASFSWNDPGNWSGGVVPNVSGDSATFDTILSGVQTVTLDAPQHVGSLTLNPGSNSFTITSGTGGNLVFDNGAGVASLSNFAGNNIISAPVILASSNTNVDVANGTTLTISGVIQGAGKLSLITDPGTLVLSGANTFTGGIEIDAGTLKFTTEANLGAGSNPIVVNGGTLSQGSTNTGVTLNTARTITFGTAGGTIDIPTGTGGTLTTAPNPSSAKILTSAPNQLSGSGPIIKTGNGDFQIQANLPNYNLSGNWTVNGGVVEVQTLLGLGTGSVTVNAGGEVTTTGVVITNPIILNGGTLAANLNNNGVFTSTINVQSPSTLSAAQFQATPTANGQNFAVGGLTGSGNLTVIGPASGTTSQGMVAIGPDTSGYFGAITVGLNGIAGLGSGQSFGTGITVLSGGGIGLIADGNGTGTPEAINYTLTGTPITFNSGNLGYYVGKVGANATTFDQAANKTITLSSALPLNGTNTLNVTPLNGFGLSLTAQANLLANTTFNVAGTQASNVVPGLSISNLGGIGFGIIKAGTGTLFLGDGNTFGGSGSIIDIIGGRVAITSDAGLGDPGNAIKLDTNAATGNGLLAEGTFTTNRAITIAQANTGIEVSAGKTLTLTGALNATTAGNILNKNDAGTLIMNNTVTGTWTGALNINQGVVQLTTNTGTAGNGALGNASITIGGATNLGQAALQLVGAGAAGGGITISNAINLNSTANNIFAGGINFGGQLENVSGNNTVSGAVTLSTDAALGVDTGSTLTFSGGTLGVVAGTTRALQMVTQAGATLNLSESTINTFFAINKLGAGTLNITAPQTTNATGAAPSIGAATAGYGDFQIAGGTVNVTGTGTIAGTYTSGISVGFGSTLNLNNTTTNTNNRVGNGINALDSVAGGNLNLIGSGTATSTETFKGINFGRGEMIVTVTPGAGQQANLTLTATGGAWTRAGFATGIFESGAGTSLGTAPGTGLATINTGPITAAANFIGGGTAGSTANQAILPWALVNNNGVWSFATSTVIGASGYLRTLAAGETTNAFVNSFNFAPGSTLVGTFASGGTTVNTTNTTGLFVGEAVTGAGIAANSFITAISAGTSITLSTATTAAGTSVPLTYSTTGTNLALTGSVGSLPATTNSQNINSLTLNAGASLTLNSAPQTLTLGSSGLGGPILALDTTPTGNVITGGLLTAGTNEFMVHTIPGATLTINSNITGGGGAANGGLTKADTGTLVLGGTAFYAGQTVLNGGALKLAAGTNNVNSIWYQNFTVVQPGATLDLAGQSLIVTDLFNDGGTPAGVDIGAGGTVTTSTGTGTIVLNRDNTARIWGGNLTGAVNLVRSGANTWTVSGNNNYTGQTLLNGGTTTLKDGGALSGTTALNLNNATLVLDNTGASDSSSRLPSSLPITSRGGFLQFLGRAQGVSSETIGSFNLTEGVSDINISNGTGGTNINSATLTLSDLVQTSKDATLNLRGVTGQMGSNPFVLVSTYEGATPAKTNTNNIMGGWAVIGGVDFASYVPTLGVAALNAVGYAGYDSTIIPATTNNPTQNIKVAAGMPLPSGGLNLNSLNISGGATFAFVSSSDVLNLTSGGLLKSANANVTIGSAVDNGQITAGGAGATGTQYLYVHNNNANNLTINSRIVDNGTAPVRAVFTQYNGGTTILADGLNSYTGGTVVNGWLSSTGTLSIAATGKVPAGGLTMNGANVTQTAGGVIDPANAVTINGYGTLTLAGNNTLASLTTNTDGGTAAPTVASASGVLNLSSGNITASSSNANQVASITGTLGFNGGAGNIVVNPLSFNGTNFAPLIPTLNITAVIPAANATSLNVSGGGLLQVSGASTFTGGITLAAGTSLAISGNSTNNTSGQPISGPLGTGTLTIGAGSRLIATGNNTATNAVNILGNFTFDSNTNAANNLTIGGLFTTTSLPAGATTITVNAPQAIGTLGGIVAGSGSSIVKSGPGTLAFTNNNTFSGGLTINNGTVLATGPAGGSSSALGTGTVTLNGGVLQLHNNGATSNTTIYYGNNLTINGSLSSAFIDVNNNGANTGNTIVMGALNYTGFTAGNPAPSTILNVTGGNSYRLQFTGTTLTGATSSPTFNVGSGLTLVLPGGFTIGTNLPNNIGAGSLVYSGNNTGTATSPITGTVQIAPAIGQTNTPLGTGAVTLNNGATLQIAPIYSNSITTTGYTAGGVSAKYYNTGATIMTTATNFGVAPNSVLVGVLPNDGIFRNAPATVNSGGLATTLAVYQTLLNVTSGGTYAFGGGTDDEMQIVVDGSVIVNDITAGGHALNQNAAAYINLAPGLHTVTVRAFNNGGGGSVNLFYSGPDTASNGITGTQPVNNFQALPLSKTFYSTSAPTTANNYLNSAVVGNAISLAASATATVDGLGTDFNYAISGLTFGAGSTLNVANGNGTTQLGNGIFSVVGAADATAGTATVNATTGTLNLAGGVTDGGQGLTKTGAGTLVLGSSSSFTGTLNINGGFVQLASPSALTSGTTNIGIGTTPATLDLNGQAVTSTGTIVLNGGAGPAAKSSATGAGLYNSSAATASFGGNLAIGAAIASVNPSIGGFGDIVLNGTVSDNVSGTGWNKVGPDVLTLNNSGNSFTGAVTVVAGELKIGDPGALGTNTSTGVTVNSGATMDLNGMNVSIAKPLTINGAGITALGMNNTLGALINSGATDASYAGNVTLAGNSNVGGPGLVAGANGNITLSGSVTGAFTVTKIGANTLTLNGGSAATNLFNAVTINDGTVVMSGTFQQGTSTTSNIVFPGANLVLDNTATPENSRLGPRGLFLNGNLTILGNSLSAVLEAVTNAGSNINLGTNGFGQSTITLDASQGQTVTLQVNSTSATIFNRSASGTSALIRGTGLGTAGSGVAMLIGGATSNGQSATNSQSFGQTGAAGTTNRLIYPWAVVDTSTTGVGVSFAVYGPNGVQAMQGSDYITGAPILTQITGISNTNTTLSLSNTSGLSVGELVVGANIPANTTITAVNANSVTLSAAATGLASNTFTFIQGMSNVANLVAFSDQTVGLSTAALTLNSVTLNNGANLTIQGALQLDSGGLLAVGDNVNPLNYTINGPGTLTDVNATSREIIAHVTGSQTTLTINAPIFSNGGGLTKADGGTLVLGTTETYIGTTAVNQGTLKLAGGNNTLFSVWSTAPTAGNSAAAVSGQATNVNFGGTLDLNGNNQALNVLNTGNGTQLLGGTIINGKASSTSNLHIAPNGNVTWSGNIGGSGAGTLNFIRDGNSTFTVNSPNALTGSVTLTGGATTLVDLGTFQNASSLIVDRATLIWNDTGVQAVSNRLPSTMPITLKGGGLQFVPRAGTGSTPTDNISLGNVTLGLGESEVFISPQQGSSSQITMPAIPTRVAGATFNFHAGASSPGDNPNLKFTTAPTLTNGIIGAWFTTSGLIGQGGGASFATYDPVTGVRAVSYSSPNFFAPGLNSFVTATNATVSLPAGNNLTNTVTMVGVNGSVTLGFVNATDTLTVQSGGILTGTDANAKAIGSTTTPGQITASAGVTEFFIHIGTNTLTLNSKIIDNGSNMNLVVDGLDTANTSTLTLTNTNTYGGTTYVSGATLSLNNANGPAIPGDVVLSGGNNTAGDSLAFNQTSITLARSNQLVSTANVTMNGATQLNLNSNSNTIATLTINNDGGSNGANGPTVFTGLGTLTISGNISVPTPTETFTVPTINGFLNLGSGNIAVDPVTSNPGQIGLALQGGLSGAAITKTGSGVLGIGGQSATYTAPINVNGGTLAISANLALVGGQVVLGSGTTLDTRGLTGTIGSLSSSNASAVVMNGLQGTAGTLQTGLDNTASTFAGIFNSPYPTGLLNITKIGTGAFTLTGNSTATNSGTLTVDTGSVVVNSTGQLGFSTYTLTPGGLLNLDNSGTAKNDRLGGQTLTTSLVTTAPTLRVVNMAGGQLSIKGNSSTAVTEDLGTVNLQGGGIITLNAANTGGVNLNLANFGTQNQPTSLLIRGDGLGQAAGPGIATLTVANVPLTGGQSTGGNGTTTMSIRPDIIADASPTGLGTGFLVKDSSTQTYRPLDQATELAPSITVAAQTTTNVGISSLQNITANASINSLTMLSGGGINSGVLANNPWGANGARLNIDIKNTGGILAFSGNTGITAGQIQSSANDTLDFHVVGSSTVLNLNAPINSANGFVKSDDGTLILSQPQYLNGGVQSINGINGGTLKLAAGPNTLYVLPTATVPTPQNLQVNNGTLDLNGNSQMVGSFSSTNPTPFSTAVVTNTSATAANFIVANPANTSTTFGGVISGNLSFYKQQSGNNRPTITFESANTYTGDTFVENGVLRLVDSGALTNTNSINLIYGTLQLDNTGLSDSTSRISSTVPINMSGGVFQISPSERIESQNVGTISVNQGYNEINISQYNNNSQTGSYTLNVANLTQANGGVLNFTTGQSFGSTGANPHVFLSQVNGSAFSTTSLSNNIIGPWAVINGADWASYTATGGVTALAANGAAAYATNALTAGVVTDNISVTATVQGVTTRTINTLAIRNPGAATTVGLNSATDVLTVGAGGLLINSGQTVAIQGGQLTAGATNTSAPLYIFSNGAGAQTINSQIVNNGTGVTSLVRAGGGTITLSPEIVDLVASVPNSGTTLTVPNASGLFIGMAVSGSGNIPANSVITNISGTTVTINNTLTGTAAATNQQVVFAPATSTATSSTTAGSATVTMGTVPAGFTPTAGMTIGGPNIPGGTTITGVSGTTLTLSQPAIATGTTATLTFGALSNTYTGTTTNYGGSATFGQLTLNGLPGSVVVPGDVVLSNAALVENTNQGQIAPTSNVTFESGGSLTLVGTNTLNSLTWNVAGTSGGTPTATVGTLLNLTSATPINSNNDYIGVTPTIAGTTLNLANAGGSTITTSGLSLDNLIISAAITSAGTITKAGAGSLVLPNANTAVLNWNLNGGTLILNNAAALGAAGSTLVVSGNGAIEAGTATLTVAAPVTFNAGGNLTFAGVAPANQLTLSGAINLNGVAPTLTVSGAPLTDTITGVISGSGGFTKAGPGALTLTPATANTFAGAVNISGGLLTLGNANALPAAITPDLTVSANGALNINGNSTSLGSLAGSGVVTSSTGTVVLTVGAGGNVNNTTFSGAITASTPANLGLTKTGTNNLTLTGPSQYTGATNVNGGGLVLGNNSTSASTATLSNTAITVASGASLSINSVGAPTTTVNIGNNLTVAAGASLTLSAGAGASAGAAFSMQDGVISTFNIIQGSSFTGAGLTIGGAGASANAPTLTLELGSTLGSVDSINVFQAAAAVGATGGVLNIVPVPGASFLTPGDYVLINATSGLGSGFTLQSTFVSAGGVGYSLSLVDSTASQEVLTVAQIGAPTNAYWTGGQSSVWSTVNGTTGATNWSSTPGGTPDTNQVPNGASNVFFTANTATNLTTTLGTDITINSLNFTGTGTSASNGVSISGNKLTINATTSNGNAAGNGINVAAGTGAVSIASNVALGSSQTWTNNSNQTLTVSGAVSGTANLTTAGSGTIVLSGSSSYVGTTTVSSGTLLVTGSLSGTTAVSVASGATLIANGNIAGTGTVSGNLFGNGTMTGPVSVTGGTVAPGTTGTGSIGLLSVTNSLAFNSVSTLKIDLGGVASAQHDQLSVQGLNLASDAGAGATLNLSLTNGYTPVPGDLLVVILNGGSESGVFANTTPDSNPNFFGGASFPSITVGGFEFAVGYHASANSFFGGNNVALLAIPEPNTAATLAAGLGSLIGLGRFRRRRH